MTAPAARATRAVACDLANSSAAIIRLADRLTEQNEQLAADVKRLTAALDLERQAHEVTRFREARLIEQRERVRTGFEALAGGFTTVTNEAFAEPENPESSPVTGMESAVDHGRDEGAAPPPPHPLPAGEKQWPPPQLRLIEAEIKRTLAGDETGLERNKLFEGDPCGNH